MAPTMESDSLPPASSSNAARQQRSRQGDTHPISWQDSSLEQAYNHDRSGRGKAEDLKRLHMKSTSDDESESNHSLESQISCASCEC